MHTVTKNALGQIILTSSTPKVATARQDKKLLIVIQYWNGDLAAAEALANLIADLEKCKNQEADILLFGRFDALPFPKGAVANLQRKFANVYQERCRRINAKGYPYGPNEMFYDLVMRMAHPNRSEFYSAWLNLEADCCPTRPGWINELTTAFRAREEGVMAIGHKCARPVPHLNGVAVYDAKFLKVFGAACGGAPRAAYDIQHAGKILPVARDCSEIFLDFNRATIVAEDLFASQKGKPPCLYHGVKDGSARACVRDRYIRTSAEAPADLSDKTVFTYFDNTELNAAEQKQQIELWKQSWSRLGWNPVVLGPLDAMKHPKFEEFRAKIAALPTVNPVKYEQACYLRWLALDFVGGGFLTDYDVISTRLTPQSFMEIRASEKLTPLQGGSSLVPAAMWAPKGALKDWLAALEGYKPKKRDTEEGRPHVSDQSILNRLKAEAWVDATQERVKEVGEAGWRGAELIHFAHGACKEYEPGVSKSVVMSKYLERS